MFEAFMCFISRRGKGATGTVEVPTFGKPVLDDDGVAKDWTYDHFIGVDTAELVTFAQSIPGINVNIALMQGIDSIRKSATMRSQNELSILTAKVLAEPNFAIDSDDAENHAKTILATRRNLLQCGFDTDSDVTQIDFIFSQRKAKVIKDRAKAAKDAANAPRLVRK